MILKERRKCLGDRISFLDESFNEQMRFELSNLKIQMEDLIVNEEVFWR